MTNEEVIEVLENEESYMLSHGGDRQAKALRIAINKIKRDSNTKITIDEAISNLNGILTEATENKNSVCYVTEDDAGTLRAAIDTMRKYQKIQQIVKLWKDDTWMDGISEDCMEKISEVIEDGNNN